MNSNDVNESTSTKKKKQNKTITNKLFLFEFRKRLVVFYASHSPTTLVISSCCFAEDGWESSLCHTTVGDHLFPDQSGKGLGTGLWKTRRKL